MTKEEQKNLLTEIMDSDAKDGLYDQPKTSIDWLANEFHLPKNSPLIHQAKMMYNEEMLNEFGRGYDEGLYDGMHK